MTQNELREILSQNIKTKRKELGFTQEKLSELVELSAQTINDIEGCRTWVSDKTLIKISEVLQTSPAELLIPQNTETNINIKNMNNIKSELKKEIISTIDDIFKSYV